jgi:type IV secretory pathway VirJ component
MALWIGFAGAPEASASAGASAGHETLNVDTLRYGRFGPLVLYRQREHPSHVVLFVSGDGGWNRGVVEMAKSLAGMDALVVGIDIRYYLGALAATKAKATAKSTPKQPCAYPAADFEALSQWLQHRLGFPSYVTPVLAGHSSGATLVYVILAQAPPNTFRGGISLGFCPSLPAGRPFCRGSGLSAVEQAGSRGLRVAPAGSLGAPWIVLQGAIDSSCPPASAAAFVRGIRGARLVLLPQVGHGFAVESRWMPQLREAFTRLTRAPPATNAATAPEVHDLPLVELRSRGGSRDLAVVISGDGGWAGIDRQIGETLAADGIPVVGLNSLQYFWKARTPDQTGADLTRLLRHYLQAWGASRALLIGYSRGADVLPFMVTRLPADLRGRVELVALLGPSRVAGFEFHFVDLLGGGNSGDRPTLPEILRLRGSKLLCVYGTGETDSACRELPSDLGATMVAMPGGHHFDGAYQEVARRILQAAGTD